MVVDLLGRDAFSRVVWASWVFMPIGFLAMLISLVVGILISLIAGYYGGWIDNLLVRFTDLVLSFPTIFLLLALNRVSSFIPDESPPWSHVDLGGLAKRE